MSQENEIDISSCVFRVKAEDGTVLLTTPDYKRAFQVKQFNPGSAVFVEATLDIGVNMDPNTAAALKQVLDGAESIGIDETEED